MFWGGRRERKMEDMERRYEMAVDEARAAGLGWFLLGGTSQWRR